MIDNKHIPVMLNQIISFIPSNKKINIIDATFGGGGYSKNILEKFNVNKLIAVDRDPISILLSKELKNKYLDKFFLINEKFSKIDTIIKSISSIKDVEIKFDTIIFDLGLSTNQLEDEDRGFSFNSNSPLNMNMGKTNLMAKDVVNKYDEKKIADIIFEFGQEKFAKIIARNIVKQRKIKSIKTTQDLVNIINKSVFFKKSKKIKVNPSTKTFQALRIYVNDELNELKKALKKSEQLLKPNGRIIVVSFQSLEDKIVKDFFNHKSGKKWRSSRHYPELVDYRQASLKIITKKPLRPEKDEIKFNPRSRSAKLRVAEKIIMEDNE